MIEIPEAIVIAEQIGETFRGKRIIHVTAAHSPHKFAWYHGDPQNYPSLLNGKVIGNASACGGFIVIGADDARIVLGDGVSLKFHDRQDSGPPKHQLFIRFEDQTSFSASVQMYGGLWCFREGDFNNPYYQQARGKPSPLSSKFSRDYFNQILLAPESGELSAKALLATEQRIPGLGNGVLQDILYFAGIHPRRKIKMLSGAESDALFQSIKTTLANMACQGGRDTEKDLFGNAGSYITRMSKKTVDQLCAICGSLIRKDAYLGGSIYFCSGCQKHQL